MGKYIVKLNIHKYVERGILYRGFKPFEASRKEAREGNILRERFVQVQDNISFQNKDGEESVVFFEDYLNITDSEHPYGVSKEEFTQIYSKCEDSSKNPSLCKVCVK